jgi:hypothetical protein
MYLAHLRKKPSQTRNRKDSVLSNRQSEEAIIASAARSIESQVSLNRQRCQQRL